MKILYQTLFILTEFQENIVANQSANVVSSSMLHSANQLALSNVDSSVIPEDSASSTQDANNSSITRMENLSNYHDQ